jgi:hypothetical protein
MAATSSSWPPACRSAPSQCTCCCILTPHTHLSDSAGYPHLNHIIRFPHPEDPKEEALAWFHCPHCPCALGLTWIHPDEMGVVTERMQGAEWLPRFADFEAYGRMVLDESKPLSPDDSALSPGTDMSATPAEAVLGDRTNVLENDTQPPIDKRKSRRRSKAAVRSESVGRHSPDGVKTYKPRRSKYDVH